MDGERAHELITEYSPYIAVVGAIYGAYEFVKYSNQDTELIEALLTPVGNALRYVIIMVFAVLLFSWLNTFLNTEKKRFWGAIAVIVIATIVCVAHVL